MHTFFEYNWQVRDEWFTWCNQLTTEELLKYRIGGVGGILYTLFHVIDVEHSWLRAIVGKDDLVVPFAEYDTLEGIRFLSDTYRKEIKEFLPKILAESTNQLVTVAWDEKNYRKNDILHHVIAHEIHHIGQLSVWAREVELKPISADFLGREFTSMK
ncbi:DinB family protein [Alkalihalophilus lindianensis]|uniref:DinB family protein n=1 Tax=Alkalihalophilus lindianensis TaxID=1630542 RepID=A0ABU3X4Q4_9BACI|nr:DinB family protein [Alkalihalophilus lindianensis]MDV2682868.1 DinB family protein [Alkalihalophilus lindianensis]